MSIETMTVRFSSISGQGTDVEQQVGFGANVGASTTNERTFHAPNRCRAPSRSRLALVVPGFAERLEGAGLRRSGKHAHSSPAPRTCTMLITPERPNDAPAIDALLDRAFGPDRHTKTVYRLREGVDPVRPLCFAGRIDGTLRASLRFWPVRVGANTPALLLGPIAVNPEDRGRGYARTLIQHGLDKALLQGHRFVILVGDLPYYEQFGFGRTLARDLVLPGPVDEGRLLALDLGEPANGCSLAGAVDRPAGYPSAFDAAARDSSVLAG